ncbi:MAG: hypothetical protein K0U36_01870 [Alphaproteobacteria bacterium]|nr:hypothetical protein [Alphaproteobacteria bacterium]
MQDDQIQRAMQGVDDLIERLAATVQTTDAHSAHLFRLAATQESQKQQSLRTLDQAIGALKTIVARKS